MVCPRDKSCRLFFFFNDTATTEIYTLTLHDALPISSVRCARASTGGRGRVSSHWNGRSEEHTSELQSRSDLVCRLLLEKKKIKPLDRLRPAAGSGAPLCVARFVHACRFQQAAVMFPL